jgi:hypothetical protein
MGLLRFGALGIVLVVFALVHFFKYRSGNYIWLYVIIFLGPIGALVYIFVEVIPDLRATHAGSGWFARRKRTEYLEAVVRDNPSAGNYEELADLYRERGDCAKARESYNHAISSRTDSPDPFYGRALCALVMNDVPAAVADLEKTVSFDRKHDYFRALGLLAHCYALQGDAARAEALFREALQTSTASETQFNFAEFLASQGRSEEARSLAEAILHKRATLSGPLRRQQEPWFGRAEALLKRL